MTDSSCSHRQCDVTVKVLAESQRTSHPKANTKIGKIELWDRYKVYIFKRLRSELLKNSIKMRSK